MVSTPMESSASTWFEKKRVLRVLQATFQTGTGIGSEGRLSAQIEHFPYYNLSRTTLCWLQAIYETD